MSSEKPCSEAPKHAVADADGGRPHPSPAPPTPEPSCPPPDEAPSALPPYPPATGAAPKIPSAPNSSAQQAAAAAPDCRSFSQLLAGAMASPAGSPRSSAPILSVPVDAVRVPVVAVPCFITPAAALLESPRFTGQFAMTHQAVLATVTAQAQMQAVHPSSSDIAMSSFPQPILSTISPVPLQQRRPDLPEDNVRTPEVEQVHSSDQKAQSAQIVVDTNSGGDGYNWRKYGQKQVKSSENSRSYYKCTNGNCFAKKKVERCPDGRITEVMYRGQHNHDPPQQTRYSRERRVRSSWPLILGESESVDLPSSEINESDPSTSKTDQNSGNETPDQQFFCSSDCEGDTGIKTEDDLGDEPDPKRRLSESTMTCSAPPFKVTREPKIVVQAASDAGQVSDGYRWRKYGQKFVKGNPNPRSYYRCTHNGCPVRKHVERASDDAKSIVMTYEGKHNHELPGPKNTNDPSASPRLVAASVAPDEQLHTSKSLLDQKPPTKSQPELDGESTGEKASELGGEKALESAQALLSIGFNSSAERSMAEPIPRA